MKAILLCFFGLCITAMLQAQISKTADVTAGNLKTVLTPDELNSVTNLTLIGTIDARDFKTMRDDMPLLAELDLSGVTIEAYNGPDGTSIWGNEFYSEDAIPESAFLNGNWIGKKSLTSIVLPGSVTLISYYAFNDCGLVSITIPNSLIAFYEGAFANCYDLISINIPSGVTTFGYYVFYGCSGLTSIYANPSYPVNLHNSGEVFTGVDKMNCTLYVPYGSMAAYQTAYQWQDFIYIVEASEGFSLSTGTVNIASAGGSTGTATITANVPWTASSNQSWLTVSPESGTENQTITFTVTEANTSIYKKQAIVTFSATGFDSQAITVFQSAEVPTAVVKKTDTAPVLDGTIDDIWATANTYNIDRPFINEYPTLGDQGAIWKALWSSEGIYLLVEVTDDIFMPAYAGVDPSQSWMYDKPEIYFDVNPIKKDGLGPSSGIVSGHHQYSPTFDESSIGGGVVNNDGNGVLYSFKVDAPNYVGEYFIPFSILTDKDGILVDYSSEIGFDITVIDGDTPEPIRNRAVWANIGEINESWANMDDAGTITLEGAEPKVFISQINITDGTINSDNGTLQMIADIQPSNATVKNLRWSVENGTGRAKIDAATGLLTAVMNGTVTVKATARDGSNVQGSAIVTISGQVVQISDIEIIKNGKFVTDGGLPYPWDWFALYEGLEPKVEDGVAVCSPAQGTDYWEYQFLQTGLEALPNIDYIFTFTAWADADRPFTVDFEDTAGNGYNRYGSTPDPESSTGRSQWDFMITTVPTQYTFHVNFDQILPSTIQKVVFMMAQSSEKVYIDNVSLISVSDLEWVDEIPVANAGADQTVNKETLVVLDGSASYDPDGNPVTYQWIAPEGIILSSVTDAQPTFISPKVVMDTELTFSLVVFDGTDYSPADEVTITVLHIDNKTPAADAGKNQSVEEGELVTLDGTASKDHEDELLTYFWTAPEGVTLSANNIAQPTFIAPMVNEDTPLQFSLVVNDGYQDSEPDLVTIYVINGNDPPVAVCKNITVVLDNSGEYILNKFDLENLVGGSSDDRDFLNQLQISAEPNSFSCSDVEIPVHTLITLTDKDGASSTCNSTVSVVDLTGPLFINRSKNIRVNVDGSEFFVLPDLSAQFPAMDNCSEVSYIQYPLPGTIYKSTTNDVVSLTALDLSGNATNLSIDLKVTIKGNNRKSAEIIPSGNGFENSDVKVYPNPFSDKLFFEVKSSENSIVSLEIFNASGSKIESLNKGQIISGGLQIFEFVPVDLSSQLLLYKLTINNELHFGKVVYKK